MGAPLKLEGQRFGRLVVVRRVGLNKRKLALWECVCDCGTTKTALGTLLKRGRVQSCGCYIFEKMRKIRARKGCIEHGLSQTVEFFAWQRMIDRCTNSNCKKWDIYGGRGITICDRYRYGEHGKAAIECLLEDIGHSPGPGYSPDRIDNNRGYEPGNVRWATAQEQANNRRSNRIVTALGCTDTVANLARKFGVDCHRFRQRVRLGWHPERALVVKSDGRAVGRFLRRLPVTVPRGALSCP